MTDDATPLPVPSTPDDPAAILFDLDGTIVDTVGTRVGCVAAHVRGGRHPGRPGTPRHAHRQRRQAPGHGGRVDRRTAHRRRCARRPSTAAPASCSAELNTDPRPLPGIRELIRALDAAGIPWTIATSSRAEQVGQSLATARARRPAAARRRLPGQARQARPGPAAAGRRPPGHPRPPLLVRGRRDLGHARRPRRQHDRHRHHDRRRGRESRSARRRRRRPPDARSPAQRAGRAEAPPCLSPAPAPGPGEPVTAPHHAFGGATPGAVRTIGLSAALGATFLFSLNGTLSALVYDAGADPLSMSFWRSLAGRHCWC